MISIDKLSIQGIRSFNPREVSTIDFYKPLTIIVGHNGKKNQLTSIIFFINLEFENLFWIQGAGKTVKLIKNVFSNLKKNLTFIDHQNK